MRSRCRVLSRRGTAMSVQYAQHTHLTLILSECWECIAEQEKRKNFSILFFSLLLLFQLDTHHAPMLGQGATLIYNNMAIFLSIISMLCVLRIVGNETGYELRVSVAFISKSFRWRSVRSEQFSRGPLAHTIVVIAEIILIISINYAISCLRRCDRFWKGRGCMPLNAMWAPSAHRRQSRLRAQP